MGIFSQAALDQLKLDEGHKMEGGKHFPYDDADGKMIKEDGHVEGLTTIGYGHNMDALGIDEDIAEMLLARDIEMTIKKMQTHVGLAWIFEAGRLNRVRQEAFVNMAFNMGAHGLSKFKNALGHARDCDWINCARELQDSRWFKQVGDGVGGYYDRAERLIDEIRTGARK